MKKIVSLALAAILLLSCAVFASADSEIELNVGILDGWTGFTTKYIVDQGLDVANGIKINYLVFSSGAPANEAMISGDIDCAIIGGGATVPSLANLDSKLIMETNNDTVGLCMIARPDLACASVESGTENIKGSADTVKGLTILTTAGSLQYYETLKYLETIGLSSEDVTMTMMDANQACQAFMLGQGDILCCTNNYSFSLKDEGYVELASLTSLGCAATAQVVCSDQAYNDDTKRTALAAYCKALAEVNDIMNNDTELASQSYVDWVTLNGGSVTMDVARRIMEEKPYYGVEATRERTLGADFLENFVGFYILTEQIDADQKPDIEANIRTDILELAGLK